ncbi:YceK/YidQ family lipoprotein [Pseudomonas helmanticensis]|uniref:YceK/YidQ family lipoprotein n=1 Tax=Pseudomonas helmanticensis TaxID=1471381 RepID=UPI0024B7FE65|nr:YceK/YidQ family lipoprotein [Pseudomonas helmanticensis]
MLVISQLSGCAWLGAVTNRNSSYDCYDGVKDEYVLAQFLGPLVIIDLPFTFIADTVSLPFCAL